MHAGGWAVGDKTSFVDDARLLSLLGFVVFSINYRLAPEHPYPAAVDDVRAAIRWLRQPAQVATFRIDPKKIGAFGASAGAHLAGMLATLGHGSLDEGLAHPRRGLVVGPDGLHPRERHVQLGEGTTNVRDFLGVRAGRPRMPRHRSRGVADHVRRQDRRADAARELRSRVGAGRPGDPDGRRAQSRAGVQHQLIVLPGIRHAGAYQPDVWDDTVAFLERYLGKPVAPTGAPPG